MSEKKNELQAEKEFVSREEIGAFVAALSASRRDQAERNERISALRLRGRLDENGREILDPTPVEVPFGHERPQTLQEQIAALLVKPLQPDDSLLEDDDEFLVISPYEQVYDPILGVDISAAEFMANQDAYKKAYEKSTEAMTLEELKSLFPDAVASGESPSQGAGGSQAGAEASGDPGEKKQPPKAAKKAPGAPEE